MNRSVLFALIGAVFAIVSSILGYNVWATSVAQESYRECLKSQERIAALAADGSSDRMFHPSLSCYR